MMLRFPNLDTLRLALTSGVVPPAVGQSAATAGIDDAGAAWVDTRASASKAVQNDLRRLGVQIGGVADAAESFAVRCWPEILPLERDADPLDRLEQTPILFETTRPDDLGRLVVEILHLGNDRQQFRWLESKAAHGDGDGRGLLRVVGPPYYSLLRALDRHGAAAPRAYRERAPRVWVEVGWTHPLADHLRPPADKMLLAAAPRQWALLDEAPFRDVYEVIEFVVPDHPTAWDEGELADRIRAALRLTAGGSADGAELWVVRDDPVEELNRLVQNSDDPLLHRLAFAVGAKDGRQVIVLRTRHSRLPPPELVLNAEAYKPYLKLPNLFVPAGRALHPPLRRDMVRKLLADNPAQVTWLAPGDGGAFRPETLPEDAFRPLIDWIDYVLDHEKEALQAWVQAAQFDLEPFVCDEDQTPRPKKPSTPPESKRGKKKSGDAGEGLEAPAVGPQVEYVDKSRKKEKAEEEETFTVEKVEPTELQRQLRELEEKFVALEGGLDAPERQAMWPQLAVLNAALSDPEEAGICWLHALWGEDAAPEAWARQWFRAEASAVRPEAGSRANRSWVSRVSTAAGAGRDISAEELHRLLAIPEPTGADLRTFAAFLILAVRRESPPSAILQRLHDVHCFLESHERLLPVRAVWLAWAHLVRLSRGDVLALARARDRLLERLFTNGLRPEQDLPGFLRFAGQATSQRFRGVGEWLRRLRDKARAWIEGGHGSLTAHYSDLLFAFGLARLGERDAALALLHDAKSALAEQDDVHMLLFKGFEYRIRQVLEGNPHGGPLPADQTEYLEHLRNVRPSEGRVSSLGYVVDALRKHSRVLEPHQHIDPYLLALSGDEIDRGRAALSVATGRAELPARVRALLSKTSKGLAGHRARSPIYTTALDAAPRAGEEFAREMLTASVENFDALIAPADPHDLTNLQSLLERAMFVAAHFDAAEHIQALVPRFRRLLEAMHRGPGLWDFDRVTGQCFRGLRKLGMRDEVDHLLGQTAEILLAGRAVGQLEGMDDSALCSLLHVAGGWLTFGRDRQAEPVLQAARSLLFQNQLHPMRQTSLACAYAAAVGQTPVEMAQARLAELFDRMEAVRDAMTTHPWYSQVQLRVIEAVILAVVSDNFTLGASARRWLDDDEYLVRRRVHAEYRAAAGRA